MASTAVDRKFRSGVYSRYANTHIYLPAVSQTLVSHFGVIYGIALFFPSLIVLLAGGFLTLDRTRSFDSPDNDDYEKQGPLYKAFTPNKKKSFNPWQFHGGVGGMLTGLVFGRMSSRQS